MDWFIAALISAVSMAFAWLTLKKSQEKGLDSTYSLAIYFIVSVLSLVIWQIFNKILFYLPSPKYCIFIFGIGCFSIISNLLVMSAFKSSPNPGIVLALNATQSIWLLGAGILLFGSAFSLVSSLGVFLVFLGAASLQYQNKGASPRWIFYGLLAGIINASYWILVKKIQFAIPEIHLTTLFIYLVLPTIPIYFLIGKSQKKEFSLSPPILGILIFSGLVGTIANIASLFAITSASNPGYAQATASSGVILTLVIAPLFSSSASLRLKHFVSAALIVAGVVIIKLVS